MTKKTYREETSAYSGKRGRGRKKIGENENNSKNEYTLNTKSAILLIVYCIGFFRSGSSNWL